MYKIEPSEETIMDTPWNIPYEDRISILKKAKDLSLKTVAYIYPVFDSSTFRYRGYNMARSLDYGFLFRGAWFSYEDRDSLIEDAASIDLIVLVRCGFDEEMGEFIDFFKNRKVRIVYDVDDLIYNPEYMPEVRRSLGIKAEADLNFWYGVTQRYYMVASRCDAYIVTNEYLAQYIRNDFGKKCYVLRNHLNWHQQKVSEEFFEQKKSGYSSECFKIGCFSGSPTHVKDLSVALPEIGEFMRKHEDAVLEIYGFMKLSSGYDFFQNEGKIRFKPFRSFVGLQKSYAEVDVNIVPLVDNTFANCKSELNYFESAIVGTITCASPAYCYKTAIENGKNGYLCNRGDWFDTLEKLYSKRGSMDYMDVIRQKSLEEYAEENRHEEIEKVLDEILEGS